ncbi:hypothetical protein DEO72_LG3g136 [Vigna unguiculata]|uniref:Uncharacterized protein n=1 Tax=Vigna unguiculata TaxID=3917 RepID=A0A4D6LAL8_VIGUN|nr:hypothetical protein DEO72_LG3g135 [Vigna unguiculata]QCD85617.1 hypothetical protein DEO72_LG3g136 [Vigna unguiculata]
MAGKNGDTEHRLGEISRRVSQYLVAIGCIVDSTAQSSSNDDTDEVSDPSREKIVEIIKLLKKPNMADEEIAVVLPLVKSVYKRIHHPAAEILLEATFTTSETCEKMVSLLERYMKLMF